jgi:acyl carrier protein
MDLTERVIGMIESIYSLPSGVVSSESKRGEIEQWDSLGHLVLVLQLEQEFGVQLSPEDIESMTSVRAIADALANRLAA